jgi:hypothetical protein
MRPGTTLPKLVLNVPAVAGKTEAEVARLLGPSERSDGVVVGDRVKHMYHGGTIEVVFVNGRADWIKLHEAFRLPFNGEALRKLGLPAAKPNYVNPTHVMSWNKLPNIKEVTLYAGPNGRVSSAIVCVRTRSTG